MTGSLDEAFAQADAQLNNSDGEQSEAVEQVNEPETPADVQEGEKEAPEQEQEAEDKQESFTKFNPEELPEELKGVYKSLQADYTRKTQEAAKIRKESEARIAELEKQMKQDSSPKSEEPKTPEQQVRDLVKNELESEKVVKFRESAIKDYEATDDRLKLNTDTYDKATDLFVGQEMDSRLQAHLEAGKPEYTFEYKEALKEVLSDWDTYLQSKQKAYLEEQQKKAKAKTTQVQKQNPRGQQGQGRPKRVSLDEAISMATQGA